MDGDLNMDATLRDRHDTPSPILSAKLRRVHMPASVLFRNGRLTINDVYSASSKTYNSLIPADLQLPFIFTHHNDIYATKGTARPEPATDTERNIMRAEWYWCLDRTHSFTQYHGSVRINLVFMLLTLADPRMRQYCHPDKLDFVEAFVEAWMEDQERPEQFDSRERFLDIWAQGNIDLVCFTKGQVKRLLAVLHETQARLEADTDYIPAAAKTFVDQVRALDDQQIMQYGPLLALEWLRSQRATGSATATQETGLEDLFADIAVTKASDHDLDLVDWDSELVQSLLVEIDESVKQVKPAPRKEAYWMDTKTVFAMVNGEYASLSTYHGTRDGGLDAVVTGMDEMEL
jgi:hypothetical protein